MEVQLPTLARTAACPEMMEKVCSSHTPEENHVHFHTSSKGRRIGLVGPAALESTMVIDDGSTSTTSSSHQTSSKLQAASTCTAASLKRKGEGDVERNKMKKHG
ncbi:hypothetical protein VIGAN_03193000 [Vigna angularis var. angularis]|uniref:Uncharacterized protein n=1 Tax=Vigna angularis var. angularis TaxID=157739 RepID=A0A0S3RN24_PHAAN|nr:hypothetical protein VIGAN_03193000 [Vigna angularis var. angularis]